MNDATGGQPDKQAADQITQIGESEPESLAAGPTGAQVTGAQVTGADFTDSEFTDSEFTGAELSGGGTTGPGTTGANPTGSNQTDDPGEFSVDGTQSAISPVLHTVESDVMRTDDSPKAPKRSARRKTPEKLPEMVGRYRIERLLGEGGFGSVYLAWDADLQRNVTVKVPHTIRVRSHLDVQMFLSEARTLAKLEHPHVVPVHDVGHTLEGVCYIVSRYIDGKDLYRRMKSQPISIGEAVALISTVAQAVHYAHTHGVIHRDIKPNNILLDKRGTPYLADFGLALLEEDAARSSTIAGTPSYMSPEQARGENHLVKGASDIFALGIVLYELIAGNRPFLGDTPHDVLQAIQEHEARPLREIHRDIPAELDRICMKALCKRAADRHTTALDFAEDLTHFLSQNENLHLLSSQMSLPAAQSNSESSRSSRQFLGIVPKGLRSFGPNDAHFFLGLLPGPYDRDGMPESILFWRRRIEALDPEDTFRVGLIYGPSGCGKSSFVKAGLMPTIADNVTTVFIEAAAGATETRLLNRIQRSCPYLDTDLGLRETIATLRHGNVMGEGKKVLIVIDQFEQWLYSIDQPEHSELARALRQCDGEHVQCILMVRDDFWLAFSRFMDHLEIELMQNQNMAMIDLFDIPHAQRVLTEFGRAFGRLPQHSSETNRDQKAFVSNAIDDLAENGKVTPVRLALFAEMIKSKPWTTSTLRKVGGTAGVGVLFLEENFASESAPADYRMHRKAVHATLAELLPQPGANLKGHMKSRDALLEASGYADQPKQFQSMMRALDSELHLITRTDPEGKGDLSTNLSGSQSEPLASQVYYQLAHDYLVPSIRQWQAEMQQGTRKGRAEIRLAHRAEVWHSRPDNRHLPSWSEWAAIRLFTSSDRWDDRQRRMMKLASKRHTINTIAVVLLCLLTTVGLVVYSSIEKARSLTTQLAITNVAEAPNLLKQLSGRERWSAKRLKEIQTANEPSSKPFLFASIALLETDRDQVDNIKPFLLNCDPETLRLVLDSLGPFQTELIDSLWETFEDVGIERKYDREGRPVSKRFNAALSLGRFSPPDTNRPDQLKRWRCHADYLADELIYFRNIDMQYYGSLLELARPISTIIADRLATVMADNRARESARDSAHSLLADLFKNKPSLHVKFLLRGNAEQLKAHYSLLEPHKKVLRPYLDRLVKLELSIHDPNWKKLAIEKANAASLLFLFGASSDDIWALFKPQANPSVDPTQGDLSQAQVESELKRLLRYDKYRTVSAGFSDEQKRELLKVKMHGRTMIANVTTKLIQRAKPCGIDPGVIARRLLIETDDAIRCGLIQVMGSYQPSDLDIDLSDHVVTMVKTWFKTSPRADIHANAFWFLNLEDWGGRDWVRDQMAVPTVNEVGEGVAGNQWYVNKLGVTMVELPSHDPDHSYCVDAAIGHVTLAQLLKWKPAPSRAETWYAKRADYAVGRMNYHEAVDYCNWLTLSEGMGKDQLCYPEREKGSDPPVELVRDYRERRGYRLPTSKELYFLQQGGCITDFSFGSSTGPTKVDELEELWSGFSPNHITQGESTWAMGEARPNRFGIFDSYMNVRDWTNDVFSKERDQRLICGFDYRYYWGDGDTTPTTQGFTKVSSVARYYGFRLFRSRPADHPSDDPIK